MNSHQATMEKMTTLRLHGMAQAYRNLLETGKNMDLTVDEALSYMVDSEWDEKHNRKLKRLIIAARFRYLSGVIIFTRQGNEYSPVKKIGKFQNKTITFSKNSQHKNL